MNSQTLIDAAYLRHRSGEKPEELHAHLAEVLRTVLDLLLDGIDFSGQPKTGAASAARILACMVATLEAPPAYIDATRQLVRRTDDVLGRALETLRFVADRDPYVHEILDQVNTGKLPVRDALNELDHLWHWSR